MVKSKKVTGGPVSGQPQSNQDKAKETAANAWDKTKEVTGSTWDKTKEVTGSTWDKTKEVSGKAWDNTKDFRETAWDKTKDASKYMATKTGELWEKGKEKVQSSNKDTGTPKINVNQPQSSNQQYNLFSLPPSTVDLFLILKLKKVLQKKISETFFKNFAIIPFFSKKFPKFFL